MDLLAYWICHLQDQDKMKGNNLKKKLERAKVLDQWIEDIEKNVNAIRKYVNKLDDLNINQKELRGKIEHLFQNNTSICHKVNRKLKELEEELNTKNAESQEGRIKSIHYNTLKTRYQNIFRENSSELEKFRNIQKSYLEAQLKAKGVSVTDEEPVSLLENNTDIQLFTDNTNEEIAEARRVLANLEHRHQQLLEKERMLVEVRNQFLQTSSMVTEQQDSIDRTEYKVQIAEDCVGRVPEILKTTNTKKKKSLKCKICIIIAFAVLVAILLILLFK